MKKIADTPTNRARFPCVFDTASVDGLNRLVARAPRDWRNLLIAGAPHVQLHRHVTIGEVVGTRADRRALPRGTRDVGRLRQARWAAAVLGHFEDTVLLDVDGAFVDKAEEWLVRENAVAPSSARKIVQHLVALRASVAGTLGAPQLVVGSSRTQWTREAPLSPEEYRRLRLELPAGLRVAADLVTTCRLRPAVVLGLQGEAVGSDGASVKVPGRSAEHLIPVPVCIRKELAAVAAGAGSGQPLFPGRSAGGTFGVAALRGRVRAAGEAALGRSIDLRDLGVLAQSILGGASGNPSGRGAALRRIAPRWQVLDQPPEAETPETGGVGSSAPQRDDSEVQELRSELSLLRREIDRGVRGRGALDTRTSALRRSSRKWETEAKEIEARVGDLERRGPIGVEQSKRLREAMKALRKDGRWLDGRIGRHEHETDDKFAKLSEELESLALKQRHLRSALVGLSIPVGALVAARAQGSGWDELMARTRDALEDASEALASLAEP